MFFECFISCAQFLYFFSIYITVVFLNTLAIK